MELMNDEIKSSIPKLYSTEEIKDPTIRLKYFTPDAQWTWYVIEYDGNDLFFGLVEGFETELGYFRLSELKSIRGPLGLPIERDLFFPPTPLSKILKKGRE